VAKGAVLLPADTPVTVLRTLVRGAVRPLFGPAVPIPVQRLLLEATCLTLPGAPVRRARAYMAGVPVLILSPADGPAERTVLYFHGGGYAVGSARGHLALTSRLARAARARVISVDYRLAPEHPFPAAWEDAAAVYGAVCADGEAPGSLCLAGDSAGGGLALATVFEARRRGLAEPGALVLFSPWLDLRPPAAHAAAGGEDPMLTAEGLERWAALYCGSHPREDPRLSPGLADDLSGLPPTLIQYDTGELLARDTLAFRARAQAAGSELTLAPFSGLWHVFELFTPLVQARAAITLAGEFVAAHTAPA
jgi:monoterpene epsilon-lactone hydrolase